MEILEFGDRNKNSIMQRLMLRLYLDVTHKSQQRDTKTLVQATKSICPQKYLNDFLQVLDNMSNTISISILCGGSCPRNF